MSARTGCTPSVREANRSSRINVTKRGQLSAVERRQAVRVMKALAVSPARMERDSEARGHIVLTFANGPAKAGRAVRFSQTVVDRLVADDLAQHTGVDGLIATQTGIAWLRRALSGGEGFAAQHRAVTTTTMQDADGACETLRIDLAESPLAWLSRRKRADGRAWIGRSALMAGERLRSDYTRGRLSARVTADWSGSPHQGHRRSGGAGGVADLSDAALDARDRVHRALQSVGPELSGVLVDVCCELQGLEGVERARCWPVRSGKVILSLALERLAAHYGLAETARGRDGGRARHWGTDDYRPSIDGG